ncbi:MAG: hypothetical protein KC438_15490, partial [Thermomicrobiales bacterium]|nr:hypothetical protein [Thermomicrobiales bacterium]
LGIVASGLALAGRSAYNHQRELDALNRMYGESAQQLVSFSREMENLTNVTDDQALVMANTMGTLVQNYGMSVEQIETLIQRTIDLAALKGKSFEEAAQMIQNAMRGEAEYAEQLGLTLNDRALGIDRLAKSTTDAEKAQIRFNAFLEQSAYSIGYAEEQTDGFYGAMYDLKGEIIDGAQALGEFMGPFGELGAFASQNAVQIAALTLAAGQLGSTLKATGLLGFGGRAGAGALGVLAGPVGLAALFAGGAYMLSHAGEKGGGVSQDDYLAQAGEGAAWLDLVKSQMAMSDAASYYQIQQGEAASEYVTNQLAKLGELSDAIEGVGDKTLEDLGYTQTEANAIFSQIVDDLVGPGGNVNDIYAGLAEFEGDIASIFANSGPGRKEAIQDYKNLISQWESGTLTSAQMMSGIDRISDNLDTYNLRAQEAEESTESISRALGNVGKEALGIAETFDATGAGIAATLEVIEGATQA